MSVNRREITRRICLIGVLIAANVVLSRLMSISLWNQKIGFGFVPVVLGSMLLGPWGGALIGALGDFIGALAFPIGPYFPGFTLTAFLTGGWYGLCLRRNKDWPGILTAVLVTEIAGSVLMNSLWISLLYDAPFVALLPGRITQAVLMGVAEIVVMRLLVQILPRLRMDI